MFLASLFAIACRGVLRHLFVYFSWMYIVLLSFLLLPLFPAPISISFSLASSTVPSLGSFVFLQVALLLLKLCPLLDIF